MQKVYRNLVLIDTSAVIALHDPTAKHHVDIRHAYASAESITWAAIDITSHECFTRVRYKSHFQAALETYSFLCNPAFRRLSIDGSDEKDAIAILQKYQDQKLSFHDALCAVVMKRTGIFRVMTLDRDFSVMGFELVPGVYY